MSIKDSFIMAVKTIWNLKLRSILTIIGISIGIFSVIVVIAIGRGGEEFLKSQFIGSDDNIIEIYYIQGEGYVLNEHPAMIYSNSILNEVRNISSVKDVVAYSQIAGEVSYLEDSIPSQLIGIDESYYSINNIKEHEGRLIDRFDINNVTKVASINTTLAESLFGRDENKIGKVITINNIPFEVVGTFSKETSGILDIGTEEVILPKSTLPVLFGHDNKNNLVVEAENLNVLELTGDQVISVLNNQYTGEGSFEVANQEIISEGITQITSVLTTIVASVAGISILVGGIGVMNVLLISIAERTNEIGLLKSIGATKEKILVQILLESIILTTIGGIIGVALSAGIINLVALLFGWPVLISLPVMIFTVLFSMLVGVIFGIIPSNKAAKLNPIDALRK